MAQIPTDPSDTKPIRQPGDVLEKLPPLPRTFVVRYEDGHEREITMQDYHVDDQLLLNFVDGMGKIRATFRKWASVESKLHDDEHPERGSDVPPL
jgi:hypothetical protein